MTLDTQRLSQSAEKDYKMQWRRVLLFCSLVFTHVDTTDRPDVQAVSKHISYVRFIEETSENMENTTKMFQSEEQTSTFLIERSSVYLNIKNTSSQIETHKSKHEWIQAMDITQAVASIVEETVAWDPLSGLCYVISLLLTRLFVCWRPSWF